MRVVTPWKLEEYAEKEPSSKIPLLHWYEIVKQANWNNINDIRNDFRTVDYVGSNRYVFDIKGNDYRLVAIVILASRKVYIRFFGTHKEYDKVNAKGIQNIMTNSEYKKKSKRLEDLLKQMTNEGELSKLNEKEMDKISDEIALYEDENYAFEASNLVEMIELRMCQRKLKQKDVAKILGTTPSRISEIINGKRGLTIDLARGLYTKLNIDPELILTA